MRYYYTLPAVFSTATKKQAEVEGGLAGGSRLALMILFMFIWFTPRFKIDVFFGRPP